MIKRLLVTILLLVPASSFTNGLIAPNACAHGVTTVVVRGEDGIERNYCSSADEGADGIHALRGTGLRITTKDFGGSLGVAVCKISETGTEASNCPSSNGFWHYWHFQDGQWTASEQGAGNHIVTSGVYDGWTWETGDAPTPPTTNPETTSCVEFVGARPDVPEEKERFDALRFLPFVVIAVVLAMVGILIRKNRREP